MFNGASIRNDEHYIYVYSIKASVSLKMLWKLLDIMWQFLALYCINSRKCNVYNMKPFLLFLQEIGKKCRHEEDLLSNYYNFAYLHKLLLISQPVFVFKIDNSSFYFFKIYFI